MHLSTTSTPASPSESVAQWLERRVADNPGRPLVVWYGPQDERVELSALTFANWVDKTVNLLDDLGCGDAPTVGACLIGERPGHWTSLVWTMAVWQTGGHLVIGEACDLDGIDLAVVGPGHLHPVAGVDTIACSLHPLALGLDSPVRGLIDYRDVLAQPDLHSPARQHLGQTPAWTCPLTSLTHAALAQVEGVAGRTLVPTQGRRALDVVVPALLGPLRGGGSVIVVEGTGDRARVDRIGAAEHADHLVV